MLTQTGTRAEERAKDAAMQTAKQDAAEARVRRFRAQEALDGIDAAVEEHARETNPNPEPPAVEIGQGEHAKQWPRPDHHDPEAQEQPRAIGPLFIVLCLAGLVIACIGWVVLWVLYGGVR